MDGQLFHINEVGNNNNKGSSLCADDLKGKLNYATEHTIIALNG